MQNNKYFNQFVDRLDVNQESLETLKNNNIMTLGELGNYKKNQLKELGLVSETINKIEIELELLGLSLKGSL